MKFYNAPNVDRACEGMRYADTWITGRPVLLSGFPWNKMITYMCNARSFFAL